VVVLGPELLPRPAGPTSDRPFSTSTTTGQPDVVGGISARTEAVVTEVTVTDAANVVAGAVAAVGVDGTGQNTSGLTIP
jgi:hypothetical protein